MSLRDRLNADPRAGLPEPRIPNVVGGTLRSRLDADPRAKWPDPLPGMIPQAQVMPDAKGEGSRVSDSLPLPSIVKRHLPTSIQQVGALGKEYYKNLGGAALAVPQALRHPIATAAAVPAIVARDAYDLAEIALPHVGDEHPIYGHKTVNKVVDWAKGKIAEDAPSETVGEYAGAVPELLSIAGPIGGITRIPKVEKALVKGGVKIATKLGKARERFLPVAGGDNGITEDHTDWFITSMLRKHDPDPDLPGIHEVDRIGWDGNKTKDFIYRAPDGRVLAAGDAHIDPSTGRWEIGNLARDTELGDSTKLPAGKIILRMMQLNPDEIIEAGSYSKFSGGIVNKRAAQGSRIEVDPVFGVSGLRTKITSRPGGKGKDPRTASRGRELLSRVLPAPRLKLINLMYQYPAAFKKARKYIDDPWGASTPYEAELAERLREARYKDIENWKKLSYRQKKILAVFGNFRKSENPELVNLASEIGIIRGQAARNANAAATSRRTPLPENPVVSPFRTAAPAEAPKTKRQLRDEAIEAGTAGKHAYRKAQVQDFMEKYVLDPGRRFRDYAFSRPGTKGALAARFADQPVRRMLTRGVSRWVELAENERRRLGSQTEHETLRILSQAAKHSNGDWDKRGKLMELANEYLQREGASAMGADDIAEELARRGVARNRQSVSAANDPSIRDPTDIRFTNLGQQERWELLNDMDPSITLESFFDGERAQGHYTFTQVELDDVNQRWAAAQAADPNMDIERWSAIERRRIEDEWDARLAARNADPERTRIREVIANELDAEHLRAESDGRNGELSWESPDGYWDGAFWDNQEQQVWENIQAMRDELGRLPDSTGFDPTGNMIPGESLHHFMNRGRTPSMDPDDVLAAHGMGPDPDSMFVSDEQRDRFLEAYRVDPTLTPEEFIANDAFTSDPGDGPTYPTAHGEEPPGFDDVDDLGPGASSRTGGVPLEDLSRFSPQLQARIGELRGQGPMQLPADFNPMPPAQRTWADGSPIEEPPAGLNVAPGTAIPALAPEELESAHQLLGRLAARPNEGTGIRQSRNILRNAIRTGDPEAIRDAMGGMERALAYEESMAANQSVRLRLMHRGRKPPRRTHNGGISVPEHMVRGKSAAERATIYDELDESLPPINRGPDVELPDEFKAVLDDIRKTLRTRYEKAAVEGNLPAWKVARLRNKDELFLKVYRAAHDPTWIDRAKSLDSWSAVKATIKKANTTWTDAEVNGAIEKLLDINVARKFEENGLKALGGMDQISKHPILKHIFSNDDYADMVGLDIEHLYGKINDAATSVSLSGDVLANFRAHSMMMQGLTDDLHGVGLALPGHKLMSPRTGYVDVSEHFGLKGPKGQGGLWVPPELEEVYKMGPTTYREMHDLTRALLKTGARWRVWSTVYSPTTTIGQALSNTFAFSGSGDLYRLEAPTAIQHAFWQAGSAIRRGGQAAKDRRFEMGVAGHGLGPGAIGGEVGTTATELGMTPKVGHTGEVYPWMEKIGIDPKAPWARTATDRSRRVSQFARDAFHQGDAVFKKAMAQLIATDFEQIRLQGTQNDIQRIMVEMFGSGDPASIAADMTSNMTQSYQRGSRAVKDLGRGGVIGLFASFPYESTRNFGWTATYTAKYLKGAMIAESPVVKKILMERALRSIAGMSINLRFLSELGNIASEIVGPDVSEDEREAYQRIAPDYDKGPMAILGRDKENLTYIPGGNLEYFQTPRRILQGLGRVAGSMMKGQWNKIDEDLLALTSRLSDDFLQFHQPVRGVAEAMFNRKIEGSPVSTAAAAFRRRAATRLSTQPIGTEYASEVYDKAIKPALAPTPIRQAMGLGDWATSPDPEAGISPREVSPIKVRNLNLPKTLGAIGGQLAEEKNNFATQINKINKELISPQEKAVKIMALRDDWNSDFGPKVARELKQLRKIFTRKEINDAMQQVGDKTTIAAVNGRVPRFDLVFKESIPGRVKFYMRQKK